jgi:ACS family tartrate transporter-like MFS transporter
MDSISVGGRRLIGRKVLLVLCLGNFVSFLDRVNVSYAALAMNREIGLTPALFGFGAGLFFVAYALLEVPSNYGMVRAGGPRWFSAIMISWGVSAAAMAFVRGPSSFFALRFLLGACEAGFAPGAFVYFTRWYPRPQMGRVNAAWILTSVTANIFAGPLAAVMLKWNAFGLSGWRWMFLAEAAPAILLGIYILKRLPRDPRSALWLSAHDRDAVLRATARVDGDGVDLGTFARAFSSGRVWLYSACFCIYLSAAYGFSLWLPQVLQSTFARSSNAEISLISVVPWLCAAAGAVLLGFNSDRVGDRRWHLAFTAFWVGACLISGVWMSGLPSLVMVCLAAFGLNAFIVLFVAVPMGELKGVGAASGLAIINGVGATGGFAGPYIFGVLRQWTGSFHYGMVFFGCMAILAGLIPLIYARAFPSVRGSAPRPNPLLSVQRAPSRQS